MAVISVPKTPRKAYNPGRPSGTLLQNQLRHLEWAVRPAGERVNLLKTIKPARSEADAAARIAKLTQELQRLEIAVPIFIGGKLNRVPDGSNTSLPVDISKELAAVGAIACPDVDTMLGQIAAMADERALATAAPQTATGSPQ